jgi:hypothetical protein
MVGFFFEVLGKSKALSKAKACWCDSVFVLKKKILTTPFVDLCRPFLIDFFSKQ